MLAAATPSPPLPTAEHLESRIQAIKDHKFNFLKQIQHWIGSQEIDNPLAIEDDRTEKLDVRGLLLSNPKNMEAELKFYKDLFSKLKFNFLEQTTKETFLKSLLAVPTQWSTSQDIGDTEQANKVLKSHLKTYKKETEQAREELARLVDQVCNEHEHLSNSKTRAQELQQRMGPLMEEIDNFLATLDPEQKSLAELKAENEEMMEPSTTLTTTLTTLTTQTTTTTATTTYATHALQSLQLAQTDLETKVSDAKAAVQLRDPLLDGHLVWCQNWAHKVMEMEGCLRFEAVDVDRLEVVFDVGEGEGVVAGGVEMVVEVKSGEVGRGRVGVDAKIVNMKLDISDIVDSANTLTTTIHSSKTHTTLLPVREVIAMIVQETRTRVTQVLARQKEKRAVETLADVHVCWDDEAGFVEVGVAGDGEAEQRIVQVRLDMDYPRFGSLWVISVVPEEKEGWGVDVLQDKIDEERIATITQLIHALHAL
ncbi:hypothetical protein HDU98_003319 [Podochytrium sp. JEL0797]|nr:hypothetical protein HDU98_003319 [Podochytrium sp. JEL0797]